MNGKNAELGFQSQPTHYEVLEVPPDASPQELREAYLRAKAAYKKDSVALYSLMSSEDTETLLQRIEEAYQVLSHPEKRRDYDRNHGLLKIDEPAKVISIDRVPPMENSSDSEQLLVAPRTDFGSSGPSASSPFDLSAPENTGSPFDVGPTDFPNAAYSTSATYPVSPVKLPSESHVLSGPRPQSPVYQTSIASNSRVNDDLAREIEQETEWTGAFLKKIRESRHISLEEMSGFTKISKAYIVAIEEESFKKLPAAVFLRGFIIQISKALKLPHEKVAPAYMARYSQALSGK